MTKNVTTEHFDREIWGVRAETSDLRVETKSLRGELNTFREEFSNFRDENAKTQDKMMSILLRLDQERVFMVEWVRRIESDVTMIKGRLKLA